MTPAPSILLIGLGNPARADDGLGPALARLFEDEPAAGLHAMWDYQPAVEHAAELLGHDAVVFADASPAGDEPFSLRRLLPRRADPFSSHALPPEAVLLLAEHTLGWRGRAFLMGLRGYSFAPFVESLTPRAAENLLAAADHLRGALAGGGLESLLTGPPTDYSESGGEPCRTANL